MDLRTSRSESNLPGMVNLLGPRRHGNLNWDVEPPPLPPASFDDPGGWRYAPLDQCNQYHGDPDDPDDRPDDPGNRPDDRPGAGNPGVDPSGRPDDRLPPHLTPASYAGPSLSGVPVAVTAARERAKAKRAEKRAKAAATTQRAKAAATTQRAERATRRVNAREANQQAREAKKQAREAKRQASIVGPYYGVPNLGAGSYYGVSNPGDGSSFISDTTSIEANLGEAEEVDQAVLDFQEGKLSREQLNAVLAAREIQAIYTDNSKSPRAGTPDGLKADQVAGIERLRKGGWQGEQPDFEPSTFGPPQGEPVPFGPQREQPDFEPSTFGPPQGEPVPFDPQREQPDFEPSTFGPPQGEPVPFDPQRERPDFATHAIETKPDYDGALGQFQKGGWQGEQPDFEPSTFGPPPIQEGQAGGFLNPDAMVDQEAMRAALERQKGAEGAFDAGAHADFSEVAPVGRIHGDEGAVLGPGAIVDQEAIHGDLGSGGGLSPAPVDGQEPSLGGEESLGSVGPEPSLGPWAGSSAGESRSEGDTNQDGVIDRSEVIDAVDAYFDGEIDLKTMSAITSAYTEQAAAATTVADKAAAQNAKAAADAKVIEDAKAAEVAEAHLQKVKSNYQRNNDWKNPMELPLEDATALYQDGVMGAGQWRKRVRDKFKEERLARRATGAPEYTHKEYSKLVGEYLGYNSLEGIERRTLTFAERVAKTRQRNEVHRQLSAEQDTKDAKAAEAKAADAKAAEGRTAARSTRSRRRAELT